MTEIGLVRHNFNENIALQIIVYYKRGVYKGLDMSGTGIGSYRLISYTEI